MAHGDIVLTEVSNWNSLTAWAHEVGVIMRDGKITDIFQKDKRSIPRKLFGVDEVRTFKAYTSPFELAFWLKDPDDPYEPDEGIVLDNTILTSDGEPVTGRIVITFSVMADMTDLLLRLLGPNDAITKTDVANAIKGDLQTWVIAFNLHEYTAADLRGNEDLLRSIHDSLNSDLALKISGFGLQLDNFNVNWGLTLEERERIKQQRHRSSVQDALREKELREIGASGPAPKGARERRGTRETHDQPRRNPPDDQRPQPGRATESVGYWVYADEPTDKALVHLGTCGYCNHGAGLRRSRLSDNRWVGPFETEEEAMEMAVLTGLSEVRRAACCLSGSAANDGYIRRRQQIRRPQKETIEVEGTVREILRDATFKVELENGYEVLADVAGKSRLNYIMVLPGDRVLVKLSTPDNLGPPRGRITYRYR